MQAADGGHARDAQVVLDHLPVALEAAAGKHDAGVRADAQLRALVLDDDAQDGLCLGVLDEVLGRGLEPHGDVVGLAFDAALHGGVHEAVEAHVVRGHRVDRLGVLKLGILGAHPLVDGCDVQAGRGAVVLVLGGVFAPDAGLLCTQLAEDVGRGGQALGVGAHDLVVLVHLPTKVVQVALEGVDVLGVHGNLAAEAGVAALFTFGGGVDKQDLRAVLGGIEGRRAAGGTVADDDDIVRLVEASGPIGEGGRCQCGPGGQCSGSSSCGDEVTTGDRSVGRHAVPPWLGLLHSRPSARFGKCVSDVPLHPADSSVFWLD